MFSGKNFSFYHLFIHPSIHSAIFLFLLWRSSCLCPVLYRKQMRDIPQKIVLPSSARQIIFHLSTLINTSYSNINGSFLYFNGGYLKHCDWGTRLIMNTFNDSWVKRDQFDVTCFIISLFNAQHVSDVNTSILRRLRLICWVISWVVLIWFDVCWC